MARSKPSRVQGESLTARKEGEAVDFIQDGHIELDGELPLDTFRGSPAGDASTASGTSSKGALQASGGAGSRQVKSDGERAFPI
jgi:hypothetical protein